jgi:hypothetical protein
LDKLKIIPYPKANNMITITNNNIYHTEYSIYTLFSLDSAEIIDPIEIVRFLSEEVELGESIKFKRLFDIASYSIDKFNEIFYSTLGGYRLEPYLQEIENNPTDKYDTDYLEIYWFCDKYEDELTIYPSLHGVSINEKDQIEYYAMDFVSMNNLKNYNIKLNYQVEFFDYNKPDDNNKILLGNKSFTLFDLYTAIFQEISFHGGPLDKRERFKDLEDSIKEIEQNIENKKENLVSFDDMIQKMEKDDKFLVKYKDLRDRVEENRINNHKNLSKLKSCLIEKLKIYDLIQNSNDNLFQYYKKLTDIEFNMQLLYGEEEEISFHKFWETPKCTCPKIDNYEIYPSKTPIFDKNCPIHQNK